MRVFAYCTASARRAVSAATGVSPLSSPPVPAGMFEPRWLGGHDLLYFRLHGKPGANAWYNDAGSAALTEDQVLAADLGGAVVVVANCYGDGGPMVRALYAAGATAVIAGAGPNYAAVRRVVGADLLVRWVILGLRMGLGVDRALSLAQMRLKMSSWRASDRDAAQFVVLGRRDVEERDVV